MDINLNDRTLFGFDDSWEHEQHKWHKMTNGIHVSSKIAQVYDAIQVTISSSPQMNANTVMNHFKIFCDNVFVNCPIFKHLLLNEL